LKKKGVASAKRLKKSCKKQIQGGTMKSFPAISNNDEEDVARSNNTLCVPNNLPYCNKIDTQDESSSVESPDGLDIEGDLFFDTLGDPLNESDDESRAGVQHQVTSDRRSDSEWVPFDEPPMEVNNEPPTSMDTCVDHVEQPLSDADAHPQILEEMPLPRMYIPGRIVHIYSHRGGYKAGNYIKRSFDSCFYVPYKFFFLPPAFVPRKFRSLRRISMVSYCCCDLLVVTLFLTRCHVHS
jgi:hypothetical protein